MEQNKDLQTMIGQLDYPAFLVKRGMVMAVNLAAKQRLIETGMSIRDMIVTGFEEYNSFTEGDLYLTLRLGEIPCNCTVTRLEEADLFTVDTSVSNAELQALALAAEHLCMPISEISIILDRLTDIDADYRAKLTQNLFRLQRMIGNMSDAFELTNAAPRMVTCEMVGLFEQLLEKAKTLLSHSGIDIQYHLPNHTVYALADQQLLERAVYNLLSNAAKFTAVGKAIDVTLKHIDNKLYLTVLDHGAGIENTLRGSMFSRFTRQPGIEDRRHGLGLGMSLIHSAAAAHGGTVLVEHTEGQGAKITMALCIKTSGNTPLRASALKPDIYGGRDPALIELADVLPHWLFNDKKY